MLKVKLQSSGHLMRRASSLEKTLMLWKIEGRRRKGRQRIRWSVGIPYSMDMYLSKFWEMVKNKETWRAVIHGVAKSRTWQQKKTTISGTMNGYLLKTQCLTDTNRRWWVYTGPSFLSYHKSLSEAYSCQTPCRMWEGKSLPRARTNWASRLPLGPELRDQAQVLREFLRTI